jgi:L-fucose isomerase-like protein
MSSFSHQSSAASSAHQMTDHERYDRQIRVWGAEAQARLQNSRVLICGLQNLNIEVCHSNLQFSSFLGVTSINFSLGYQELSFSRC